MILKNENKLNQMANIIESLSRYVPVHESTVSADIQGSSFNIDDSKLVNVLLFGDQLTVARVRGAMQLRDDDNTHLNRLEGFVPAIADWHARMCLLQVILINWCCYILPILILGNMETFVQ